MATCLHSLIAARYNFYLGAQNRTVSTVNDTLSAAEAQSAAQRMWRTIALDCFLIFVLTGILVKPLFKVKYTDKWASIESTFISDARFLRDHWPAPKWQPLWYTGTRFDYVYPPAL